MKIALSAKTRTQYNGFTFRSNTEATWAAHFDKAGLQWQYEPITFHNGGRRYTPDFYLNELGVFVETKAAGNYAPNTSMHLVYQYLQFTTPYSGRPLIFCVGSNLIPNAKKGEYIWLYAAIPEGGKLNVTRVTTFADALVLAGVATTLAPGEDGLWRAG